VLGFYRAQGKVKTLDGMTPITEVTKQISAILDGLEG
jgi:adenylate kinase family enzyme